MGFLLFAVSVAVALVEWLCRLVVKVVVQVRFRSSSDCS